MKVYLVALISLLAFSSCSNNKKEKKIYKKQMSLDSTELIEPIIEEESEERSDVFHVVEEMPEFGNGQQDLKEYILDNTDYPQTAIDDSLEGAVYIRFIINKKGKVTDSKVLRGVRDDLDNESLRVVSKMPDWKPGKQRGAPAKVRYILPFYFKLKSDSEKSNRNIINPKKNNNP